LLARIDANATLTVAHFIDRPLVQGEASSAPWRAMDDASW
jgi:hypothetical protein